MALRKYKPSGDETSVTMTPLNFSKRVLEKGNPVSQRMGTFPVEADTDIDIREIYFLIMHFLSAGPCKRTFGQLWNELLEHQLLPRRYHAWYSRGSAPSGDEDDDGMSLPLCYIKLTERYPHIEKDHLVKLFKQLIMNSSHLPGLNRGFPSAADVPTLLGSGSFSLLASDRDRDNTGANKLPSYLRWPHMQADQVRGLSLREIGGGFTKHHRAPSIRAACYAIAKPSTLVSKMEIIKKLRGHQNSVYCATFDRSGRYVITGSDDRLVKIWSMETAFCLASCRGHEGDITDLAVSSNNAVVASSANDFIIRVWRLPDGHPISVLKGHSGAVTAIAFSPRPSAVYQLLSSSDDGTCRIWDARQSNAKPRIYIPKPPDALTGKSTDPSPSVGQQTHQILCCAFNANGTVFVTGSSDTYARVWNAVKNNTDDSEQSNHEMDLLHGHENDVNYVQFSGCAVGSRSSVGDALKEDNLPRFKNSWFTHDNLVTCSRDGSAIIWIPRSRRSHGKVGRWTRAYHLKVPPPPMPPQPPRGGPRQRYQPTPRGVNMIVWSLDNRFVLAAIMDCRICVWNASDGSLVHSLIGHKESTFVLDVHPFNPRIAMSAGYDGKMIIWDIWEGKPVRIYETGPFKLVDGKFSPDGTSVILSDEVGQIFIVATGQGESQKDAKYDQFFLGDYRPLMQDSNGNALDQETQLAPHRRNIQDLLCDSGMIPYPEPYQSMYQRRRLGILGIEWRPTSLKLAVGPTYNVNTGDFQALPIVDLDQWVEPLPAVVDAIDWEVENDMQSDDTDSEYNVTDEYASGGEDENLSDSSHGDAESSAEDSGDGQDRKESLRRSKRKQHKSKVEFTTLSGRRVKRRNLDECDGSAPSRAHRPRRLRNGRLTQKQSLKSEPSRPQRIAKTNALTFFSKITGASTDEEDNEPDSSSSESDSTLPDSKTQSIESDKSVKINKNHHVKEKANFHDDYDNVAKPSQIINNQENPARRRLVLKLPRREPIMGDSGSTKSECHKQDGFLASLPMANSDINIQSKPSNGETADTVKGQAEMSIHPNLSVDHQANAIKWGEVKQRSSKRLRVGDMASDIWAVANACPDDPSTVGSDTNGRLISEDECGTINSRKQAHENGHVISELENKEMDNGTRIGIHSPERKFRSLMHQQSSLSADQQDQMTLQVMHNDSRNESVVPVSENLVNSESRLNGSDVVPAKTENLFGSKNSLDVNRQMDGVVKITYSKIRIKSSGFVQEATSSSTKLKPVALDVWRRTEAEILSDSPTATGNNLGSVANEEDEGTSGRSSDHGKWNRATENSERWTTTDTGLPISHGKMYNAVYKRTKSSRAKDNSGADIHVKDETTSDSNNHGEDVRLQLNGAMIDGSNRTRSMNLRAPRNESAYNTSNLREQKFGSSGASTSRGLRSSAHDQLVVNEWKSTSKMPVGLRSTRNRRENYDNSDFRLLDRRKNHQSQRKLSWLMLLEHEESYRYIPQKGDEVAYLRQGHKEYIENSGSPEEGPWKLVKSLRAVEFCKVLGIVYSTLAGSGDSCCKLTLEFIDPSSSGFGKTFRVTLPELNGFPDFLVERIRYDASIERNWTHRDKCQVWWRNADGDGGSWWDGRILAVKPKSSEFPDSPWERYVIQYKDDSSDTHLHSPWELHDVNTQWDHPCIDDETRDELLNSIAKIEQTVIRNQDNHGVQKLNQVAQKSDFLNRFPVPLSLEVIKRRLENNYYRTVDAVEHDAHVMIQNAESYFSKSAEMKSKMRRLSEWVMRTFSHLQDGDS